MKKILLISAGVLSLATLAWVQVNRATPRPLSALMPAGPMIYLEAKDFRSLLGEWNQSAIKRTWLASSNYEVFSKSNLFQKLQGSYDAYGAVAGFLPGLAGALEIAGTQSALGLYDLREQYFVYLSRVEESRLAQSQLWRLRDKYAQRQASGIPFYLRRDDASKTTVAFAYTDGWLILATRDDLMASTLALIASPANSPGAARLSDEPWFQRAVQQAGEPGELRMALNLQSLIADVRFRSYWIQRNVSELRPFDAGLADVRRTPDAITENRVFIRAAEQTIPVPADGALKSVAALRALAPADAALVRAWAAPTGAFAQSLIAAKLMEPAAQMRWHSEEAPEAASTETTAGSEQDLETRIDEPALADDAGGRNEFAALREMIAQSAPDALLQIQTSAHAGRFIRTPSALVVSSNNAWDPARVREALSSAGEWHTATLGSHRAEQLNGLATLLFSIDGKRLFLANDPVLLGATLDRIGTVPLAAGPAYAAEFRHTSEQADYLRIMQALDFGAPQQSFLYNPQGGRTPRFFSDNLASLSSTFSFVRTMVVTSTETPGVRKQSVVYR
jgi:hypothetical protein